MLTHMVEGFGSPALQGPGDEGQQAQWLLVDTLAGIVDADERDVRTHMAAMNAGGSSRGQCQIVAELWRCGHPRLVSALDLHARHHPDPAVARAARKSAMRVRTRAAAVS